MKILIDNGHGCNTPGKRSPDGRLLEYAWNREIADRLVAELRHLAYDASLLVPELVDVSLSERVRRVNAACDQLGKDNVLLISIHVNAFGDGKTWTFPSGWSAYTTPGITKSDLLAYDLYEAAKHNLTGMKIRLFNGPKEPDYEENFYILRHTLCPAVLTENGFMTNEKEMKYLLSREGKEGIVKLHVEGIMLFLCKDAINSSIKFINKPGGL